MFKHRLTLKLVKHTPPPNTFRKEKRIENSQGARRHENRRTINFPSSHPKFGKTPADCGDNAEFCTLFRKQNTHAPLEKLRITRESSDSCDTLSPGHRRPSFSSHFIAPLPFCHFICHSTLISHAEEQEV